MTPSEALSRIEHSEVYVRLVYMSAVYSMRRNELRGSTDAASACAYLIDHVKKAYRSLYGSDEPLRAGTLTEIQRAEADHEQSRSS